MIEKTFAIIKPHAVKAGHTGPIISMIENHGFDIIRMQKITMNLQQAQQFYAIHKERPFFGELTSFIASGPCIIMVLQKDDAIRAWRELMGATDPAKAAPGTIRKEFGVDISENAVHGSDAPETARIEIEQFFPDAL